MTFQNIVNYVVLLLTGKLSQLKRKCKKTSRNKGYIICKIYPLPWGYSTFVNTNFKH